MSLRLVQIGNARIPVPEVGDEATTLEIAAAVTQRLRQIEEQSERIDTPAFALRAAFEFAAQLHELKAVKEADDHDLALILDQLLSRLQELRQDYQGQLK